MNRNHLHAYFIPENRLTEFVDRLVADRRQVWGPVAKKNTFVFAPLDSASQLRLDYDITILPPKKAMFPPKQDLLTFTPAGPQSAIHPTGQILFGVHFYDIRAIDHLDQLFEETNPDENYLANRRATTIVGSSVQRISARGFWGSPGMDKAPKGQDAFLTRIKGGYVFETFTTKGEALVSYADAKPASEAQLREAAEVNRKAIEECREKLPAGVDTLAERVRAAFGRDELWDELAHDCFSCGTCNMVCPTCYCFDVQDRWNLDQESGARCRSWDGCLLQDFSQVTLGAGGAENFREKRGQRFRHRVMRKMTYLNTKLGAPACVGCGRCSTGCVPDIADPVRITTRIMEA